MDREFVEKMKNVLLNNKEELIKHLASENEDFQALVENIGPKDLVDMATDDIDKKTLETIGQQEIKKINLIDNALTRIHSGKYGLCLSCGKKIPQARLEAIPYAFMCIDCKSSDERKYR